MRNTTFPFVARQGLEWLECSRLSRLPWLLHAFSTRRGGSSKPPAAGLNLGFTASDSRARVERNRRRFLELLGAGGFRLAALRQVHSAQAYVAFLGPRHRIALCPSGSLSPAEHPLKVPAQPARAATAGLLPPGDALLGDQPGVLLSVRTADCLPILLVDPRRRAVAAVHAGWRGALERVVEKTVGEMGRVFGARPRDLLAAIGPSVRACCYEVGEEVRDQFVGRFRNSEGFFLRADRESASPGRRSPRLDFGGRPPGGEPRASTAWHLDLVAVARAQLEAAGVRGSRIQVADHCTACRTDLFFSHRREGSATGRMMAVIGIRL